MSYPVKLLVIFLAGSGAGMWLTFLMHALFS